jgi:DNA primase
MAVSCNNVTLEVNTVKVLAADAATSTEASAPEAFTITPTKAGRKILILVTVADAHGTVVCSLGAGSEFWASDAQTFNAVQNKTSAFQIEDVARFLTSSDTIVLTLTPANGKRLATDHAATVQVIELV